MEGIRTPEINRRINQDRFSMNRLISILFFLLFVGSLYADAPKDTFKLANEAFEKGAIDDAIHLYESIISNEFASATIFYNLGTAYIKKQNWAAARYYLEKGLHEEPNNKGLNQNLAYVREQVDDLYNFPHFPLTGVINQIHSMAGKNLLSLALLIFFLAGLGIGWSKPLHWKYILYGISVGWLTLIGLFLVERKNDRIQHNMAIIWQSSTPIYTKPETTSGTELELGAGLKVRTLERVGPWCRVDLADGTAGWIEEKELRFL